MRLFVLPASVIGATGAVLSLSPFTSINILLEGLAVGFASRGAESGAQWSSSSSVAAHAREKLPASATPIKGEGLSASTGGSGGWCGAA